MTPKNPPKIFDRTRLRQRRNRGVPDFSERDFLHRRAMADIVDRLETVNRSFETALFCGTGNLTSMLTQQCGVDQIFHADISSKRHSDGGARVVCDDEQFPFSDASLDLVVSLLTLHSTNDLVGALAQIKNALKPDGLFVGAMLGENTLASLRAAFALAQSEYGNGFQARFFPMAAIQDLGAAMMRAGFKLPALDVDRINVVYENPMNLIADLRAMGETNILAGPIRPLRRDVFARAMAAFTQNGGAENFEIIYLTGWAPHPDQQQPLKPGSAVSSMEQAIRGEID